MKTKTYKELKQEFQEIKKLWRQEVKEKLEATYNEADKEHKEYYLDRYGSLEGYGEFNNDTDHENSAWEQGYLYGLSEAIRLLNENN